jgi:hypothetical protein
MLFSNIQLVAMTILLIFNCTLYFDLGYAEKQLCLDFVFVGYVLCTVSLVVKILLSTQEESIQIPCICLYFIMYGFKFIVLAAITFSMCVGAIFNDIYYLSYIANMHNKNFGLEIICFCAWGTDYAFCCIRRKKQVDFTINMLIPLLSMAVYCYNDFSNNLLYNNTFLYDRLVCAIVLYILQLLHINGINKFINTNKEKSANHSDVNYAEFMIVLNNVIVCFFSSYQIFLIGTMLYYYINNIIQYQHMHILGYIIGLLFFAKLLYLCSKYVIMGINYVINYIKGVYADARIMVDTNKTS